MRKIPFRVKAFIGHLLISGICALLTAFLVFGVWYPSPLDIAMGVTVIYVIVLIGDVILGPLLTLLLASSSDKKGIKIDIAIIVLLQLVAYGYGMYSIAKSRPAWIAFDQSRFDLVAANAIDYAEYDKISLQYLSPSWVGPQYIALQSPKDGAERNERLFYELQTGNAPSMRAHLYIPLEAAWVQIMYHQKPIKLLPEKYHKRLSVKYPQATGWLILKTYTNDMIVMVDTKKSIILGLENIQPN